MRVAQGLPGEGAASGSTIGDLLSTRSGAEVGGAGGAVATQGAQSLAASRAADAGGALGEDAVSRTAEQTDAAGERTAELATLKLIPSSGVWSVACSRMALSDAPQYKHFPEPYLQGPTLTRQSLICAMRCI